MFDTIARPGEVFEATWDDVIFPRNLEPWDLGQRHIGIIRIRNPNTRWRGARQQFLLLEDPVNIAAAWGGVSGVALGGNFLQV